MMAIFSGFLKALVPQTRLDLVGDPIIGTVRPQVGQLMIGTGTAQPAARRMS